MKKLMLLALTAILSLSIAGCSTVEKEAEEIKTHIDKYITQVEAAVGKLEKEAVDEYEVVKEKLVEDVAVVKENLSDISDATVKKTEAIIAEAKKLTVDNPEVKKLHDELIGFYEEKLAACKKLVTAIENGAQADYEIAKKDIASIIDKITNHKKAIADKGTK